MLPCRFNAELQAACSALGILTLDTYRVRAQHAQQAPPCQGVSFPGLPASCGLQVTFNASSMDGVHFGIGPNLLKVQLLLNVIAALP